MGLSSWIQNVLAGNKAQAQKTRAAREDFVQLFLTRLEDRRVLNADFALVGDSLVLNNFSQTGDENLTIQDTGTEYQFILTEGVWDGTDGGGVTGDGLNTLTVDKANIDNDIINNIDINDSANIDVDIQVGPGTVDFAALDGSLEIDGAGDITQAVGSTFLVSSLDADAASLNLDEAANNFGSVTLNITAGATLRDANDITLGAISTGDTLQVTTQGVMTLTGNINTDSATDAGSVLLDGDVALGADDVTIDTDATGNDGSVSVTGTINADAAASNRNLSITSGDGNVDLQGDIGDAEALGSLSINATSGTGTIDLQNIGTATTAGVTNATTIGNAATSAVTLSGGNYTTEGDLTITANVVNVTTNTTIDTTLGAVDGTLTVNGPINTDGQILSINVGTTDLSLTNAANDFGTLLVTANNAMIVDADDIQLGASTLGGNLNVTAGLAITEAATPGVIITLGNLVLNANGNIGAVGTGALDVRVGGTASLTATGSNIFLLSDQNLIIAHLETKPNQADTIEITTTGTANLTLEVLAADFVNLETDLITLTAENGQLAIQGDALTAGSITLVVTGAGSVLLKTNLQTDGGNIDLQNAANVTLGSTITLDTELGDDGDAGNVLFSTVTGAGINATTSGAQGLTINTTSAGGNDGNVSLSDIGTGVRLGALSVIAGDGTITLNDILTDGGTVTFGSFTQLTADTLVQTLGGDVNWQNTTVFSDANGPHSLTIDTDGGDVQLGRFTNTDGIIAGTFVNNLVIDTTNGTAGTLTLYGDITLANNFQYTGGTATFLNAGASTLGIDASILTQGTGTVEILATSGAASDIVMQGGTSITTANGNVALNAADNVQLSRIVVGGTNTADITAGNAITDNTALDGVGFENIIANSIILQAANGIGNGTGVFNEAQDIDINGVTLSAHNTTAGAIQILDVDDIAITQITNLARIVILDAGGSITDGTPGDDSLVNITAGMAGLRATTDIGDGVAGDLNDIDTTVGTLAAQTVTGDINIDETDALIIGTVGGLLGLSITTGGAGNDITVTANGTLTVSNAVTNSGTGNITLTAENANNLLINANVMTNAPGNITLTGQNVTLNSTGAATPTVEVLGVVADNVTDTTPRNGIVQGLGIITVNAPGVTTLNTNSVLRTGGGLIQITTDDILINAGATIESSQANNGVVIIRNASAGRNIELGGNDGNVDLNINDAELDRIRAESLRIGRLDNVANAGNINITANFSAALGRWPRCNFLRAETSRNWTGRDSSRGTSALKSMVP